MAIKIKCPACGAGLRAPSSALGSTQKCPKCREPVTVGADELVPQSNKPPPKARSAKKVVPLSTALIVTPQPHEIAQATAPCPFCGEQILRAAIKCRYCGEFLNQPRRSPSRQSPIVIAVDSGGTQQETDAVGIISLIFGCIAVVCLLLGIFTYGVTYFAAAPIAVVGAILGIFAKGGYRVAGLTLNGLVLIPALIVFVMFFLGMIGAAAHS